jgi:hypothetical protein
MGSETCSVGCNKSSPSKKDWTLSGSGRSCLIGPGYKGSDQCDPTCRSFCYPFKIKFSAQVLVNMVR